MLKKGFSKFPKRCGWYIIRETGFRLEWILRNQPTLHIEIKGRMTFVAAFFMAGFAWVPRGFVSDRLLLLPAAGRHHHRRAVPTLGENGALQCPQGGLDRRELRKIYGL